MDYLNFTIGYIALNQRRKPLMVFFMEQEDTTEEEIDKEFSVDPGVKLWFFGRFLHFLKLLLKIIF